MTTVAASSHLPEAGKPLSTSLQPAVGAAIDMARIAALAERASSMVEQIRAKLLAPEARKLAPSFSTAQVAALCGVDKAHVNYRVGKGDLPAGRLTPSGGKREFSLAETRRWTRAYRSARMRPRGQKAITIAIGNFKGGVSKTTSAMILAQGLSLRGHRVLAIDTDPQGSLTTLHGVLPETEVEADMTIGPLCAGEQDIGAAIRSTYWQGIDLIAAAPFLFSAEFALPARQMRDPQARFWDVLNAGLEPVRDLYDVIVIDTPPSLSYVTINALWAADGLVVPVPPSGLDFASSAQFWSLLGDLGANLDRQEAEDSAQALRLLARPAEPRRPGRRRLAGSPAMDHRHLRRIHASGGDPQDYRHQQQGGRVRHRLRRAALRGLGQDLQACGGRLRPLRRARRAVCRRDVAQPCRGALTACSKPPPAPPPCNERRRVHESATAARA